MQRVHSRRERNCIGGIASQSGYRATNSPLPAAEPSFFEAGSCFKDLCIGFFRLLVFLLLLFFFSSFGFSSCPSVCLPLLLRRVFVSFSRDAAALAAGDLKVAKGIFQQGKELYYKKFILL